MVANQTGIEVGLMAARYPGRLGHLYSPGAQRGPWRELPYALDNGAYAAFINDAAWDESAWRCLLSWAVLSGQRPRWAVVPDVVGNRSATIERWHRYHSEVRALGIQPAFAAQDGMTFEDVPADSVVFLGGSTEWKEAAIGPWCARFPGRVHVGRVNKWDRLVRCWRAGAISVDGTGWFHRIQRRELAQFLAETSSATSSAA